MWKRVSILVLLLACGVAAYSAGLHERISVASLRELVEDAGLWGPGLFLLLFSLEGLGLPGIVLLLTAIAVWSPWEAFLWCWLGAQLAGIVGFAFARGIGREWISQRLPERMRRFEARVVERGVRTVILVRVVFFLAPYAHWALGLSPVRVRDFLLGSAIGYVPAMLVICLAGASTLEWLAAQPIELWTGIAGLLVAGLLVWRLGARRANAAASRAD